MKLPAEEHRHSSFPGDYVGCESAYVALGAVGDLVGSLCPVDM